PSSHPSAETPAPTLPAVVGPSEAGSMPQVPGYEIQNLLGRGAMGIVYRAWHRELQRPVALKLIRPGAEADYLERFLSEGRAAARLQHPHIVQVFAVGQHRGKPFLALEFVAGHTLAQHLKNAILPGRTAAELVHTLAQAMHYAHQRGIIHRDLKPGNILLQKAEGKEEDGRIPEEEGLPTPDLCPKITDFGLAKHLAGDKENGTPTSQILGTPSYMAPEQAGASHGNIGPHTDVYALGAVLYEALTGRPPFLAESCLDILQQVVHEEPMPPSRYQQNVPRDLETICLKCLRKEPGRRYASAQDLADDLKRYLSGQPIAARPVSKAERLVRWARRNPGLAALSGSTLLLLLLVAGISLAAALHLRAALADATSQKTLALEAKQAAQENAARAAEAAEFATLALSKPQRFQMLKALSKVVKLGGNHLDLLALRNAALKYLVQPDVKLAKVWNGPGLGDPVFDSKLELYAQGDLQGKISIRRLADNVELHLLAGHGTFQGWGAGFSPDQRYFGFATKERVRVWDLAKPQALLVLDSPGRSIFFHPNSKQAAVTDSHGNSTRVLNLTDGKEVRRLEVDLIGPGFHPYKPHLAGVFHNAVRIVDVDSGAVLVQGPSLSTKELSWLSWHPQGNLLGVSSRDGKIYLVNPETGLQARPPIQASSLRHSFSQSGALLACNDYDSVLRFWDVYTGRQVLRLPMEGFPHFFHHDTLLAGGYEGTKVKLFHLASGGEVRTIAPPTAGENTEYLDALADPDGRLLYLKTKEGLAVVDLASGIQLARRLGNIKPLGFDSKGNLLSATETEVFRWPIVRDAVKNEAQLGPPVLVTKGARTYSAISKNAEVVALPRWNQATLVWHQNKPAFIVLKAWQPDVRHVAVSPDGRWVVTGSNIIGGVGVWEAATGKRIQAVIEAIGGQAFFSPDGRWLAAIPFSGSECRLWEVGSWKPGPVLEGEECAGAFAPDGATFALSTKFEIGVLRLLETATGKELARLEIPEPTRLLPRCFTPDGATLIAYGKESKALHIFDLRLLRSQLKELGLDWPGPDYPPAPPPGSIPTVRFRE
ncbi:MAG TPA: serine/threonine-protein kinase, partial [Gemmataceae bacterium]|nr:serine/threonine-protein kinase [Gemmataceae bacterium]